jgi:maltose/moltooligosaccharide transporter
MRDSQKNLTHSFYALLSLPSTAMGFALSVQISALSWILSTRYGLDIHDIGLVWAAGPIAGILGQVIIGIVSDRVWIWGGRRRPFILIGGVLATLMLLALPNIGVISESLGTSGILGIAIVVALTLDLAINVSFNPTRAIIADVTPEGATRTKGYTWMQTISGTFGVMAYGIGAIWDNYVLIYAGAILVFAFSIVPTFFIEEPKELDDGREGESAGSASFLTLLKIIRPLWGFLIYSVYALGMRVADVTFDHYYVEIACLAITAYLIAESLMKSESGLHESDAGQIGFRKVLAAHSFTWIGVQTMFVYMFAYIQDVMPALADLEMGHVVSISFLVLNAVGAVLPAFILEPITERIGRVRTHTICIGIMSAGYAGILFTGDSAVGLYTMMGVVGIGWAATVSLPFAIMSQKVDQAQMGTYMGLFNLSVVLPQLVASLGIGVAISQAASKDLIFIIAGVSLAISALAWYMVEDEPRIGTPQRESAASGSSQGQTAETT